MRVLFSARDPGAAGQLAPVILSFFADAEFEVQVVASGQALELLRAADIPAKAFGSFEGLGQDSREELLDFARKVLIDSRPDAVFTGVSSMGFGVDEALLAEARVPTFAIQDLWGEVNLLLGKAAGTYFVLDEYAAGITRESTGSKAVVVGSPKHAAYAGLDIPALKKAALKLIADQGKPIIGFFGQCAVLPGHEENFRDFLNGLREIDRPFNLLLREHPKTPLDIAQSHIEQARHAGFEVFDATGKLSAEHWLSACDLVVTPFSTCGLDHAYLSAYSSAPLGTVLFLMTNERLRNDRAAQVRSYRFPTLDLGLGSLTENVNEIPRAILSLLGHEARAAYYERSKKLRHGNAITLIVNELNSQVKTGRI